MIASNGRPSTSAFALIGLGLCSYILSQRYYTSATLERPTHFALLTLLVAGVAVAVLRRWAPDRPDLDVLVPPSPTALRLPAKYEGNSDRGVVLALGYVLDRVQRLRSPFHFLLGCIVARAVLFWYTVRTVQCTWTGLEAFLPFFALVADLLVAHPPGAQLNGIAKGGSTPHPSKAPTRKLAYAVFAFGWAYSTMTALDRSRVRTGTVCPIGWRSEPLTPLFQLLMCALDAAIIVRVSRLRHLAVEEGADLSRFMSALLVASAACFFVVCIPRIPTDANFWWATNLYYVDIRDLLFDSIVAAGALLCGLSLMAVLHPTTIALLFISVSLLGSLLPIKTGTVLQPLSASGLSKSTAVAVAWLAPLWCMVIYPVNTVRSSTTTLLHRWFVVCYFWLITLGVLISILSAAPAAELSLKSAVDAVMSIARNDANRWASQAATSKTLAQAVAEYKRRYKVPPPPNFDKWYEFALWHNSAVIDDFGQIHEDLLPFWGIEPATIRARTAHLLEYPGLHAGGIRIRNGAVEQSPHIPGTHRWMAASLERMIEPFANWLPDMDLAINLSDECRVAVPFEEMEVFKAKSLQARDRLGGGEGLHGWVKSKDTASSWPEGFPEPVDDWSKLHPSPYFTDNVRRIIFYESVAAACPPDSPARNSRWWDWSTACFDCAAPHSLPTRDGGALLADATLANDLCHQPDMAYLDGFVMSPSAMVGTHALFPVFSQGRVSGFSDILIPSPWNFDEKTTHDDSVDLPWTDKENGLFWRGSSSDGYAAFGTWAGFLRARLAHEAYQRTTSGDHPLAGNVSFTGEMSRCHTADCAAERDAFAEWGRAVAGPESAPDAATGLPAHTPFEEHWRFRHLADMDGSGFSGRFVPFLLSNSLVHRAALFRAWFDERVRAWHHYVPADARLGRGFWAVLDLLATGGGEEKARRMAAQGRAWAKRALRPEDSQIYMFRLLLEWGRVVDDDREHIGFLG